MSDFKVKVTADLDTSQLEAKLMALQNRKITIQANANGNGLSNMNNSLQQIQNNANNVSASLKGIATTKLKVDALNFLKNQTENAVRSVTDLNKAMTLVNMTMSNMSGSSLYSLKQQSLSMAKDLSAATKTVTDAVTIYANENESVSSMLNKAQPTVLLSAASGMSSSSSADAIQGILNQFNLSEDQAMHVADTVEKLSSEIELDFAKGCDTISQSIATSGSVVNEAGMSFEKYAALVSTTAEKTRQSGSVIGNAFKTIFSRISRSKDGLTTDAEMSDAEAALKSVGVSVRGADGDLRDISDTLDDLNEVWGTLNHSQRSYVAEMAAGVRQKNIFEAAMDSYNKALQLEQDALNSDGTAMKINEKRADSINGKMEKLSATMTQLYSDAMPEEAIEGMLDFATAVAKVVDNFGLFQGALSSLGVVGGAKIISTIASNWTGLLSAITSPLGIGTIAVGGAVAAISAYQKSVSEMVESAKQAGDEWESGQENLQGQIDKISELRTALDSGTLSEQEAASAKSELLSIQEALTESYGSQVAGIDLINGSLTEQIALLDQVSQKQAEQFQNENKKGIEKAQKEIEKDRHTYLGQFYDNGSQESEAIKKSIKDLQDKYGDDVFTTELEADGITMDVHFNADASTAKEALNDFMTDVSDIEKTYGESDILDLMSDNASAGLSEANKVLDEYGDLYNQAQKAKLVADDDLFKAPSGKEQTAVKWLNDYTKAVEAYNDALSEGNSDAIKQTSTEFEAVDSAVQSLLKNSGMSEYADQFTEVKDQLNESAISANKFNEALAGNDSSKFGKQVKKSADALKDLGLTDTDFKYAFETDGVQEGEDQINSLVNAALECGLISDTSSGQVSKLVNVLSSLGIISSSAGESVDTTTESVSNLTDQIENAQTALASIEKATSILTSQSTGKSISADDYNSDELADYTSALEYNNGALQLNAEKVRELQKAKAEEAIQTNENQKLEKQSQYMENIAQIEQLQDELRGLSDAKSENAQAIQDSIDALLSENDGIVNQCNQLDLLSASLREATGAYQNWLDKQNGSESGDMFDDAMGALTHIEDVTQNTESDDYGRVGTNSYKAAVDFIVPDSIDTQDAEAVSSYIDSIEHYFNHDSDGNRTGLDVAEFCAKATKAGLMELDEASGEYKIAGQRTMQDFADGLNLSLPMVQSMFGEMEEFGAKFDWSDEAVKTLGDLGMAAGEAKSRIEEMSGDKDLDIQIDVSDIDSTEDKIKTLDNTIQQMQDYKGTLEVDSSQVDDANAVIQYCVTQKQMLEAPAVMNVDTSQVDGELGNALSLLQQFQSAQNNVELQTSVGADTSEAQGKVDGLVSEIQGLSPEIKTKLGIDTTSANTITSYVKGLTPEVMVKMGVKSDAVDAYAAKEKKSSGTVNWKNNTGLVDAWAAQMHTSNGTVTWTNNTANVKTSFTATGHVNWTNTKAPTKGSGGANGTAHASGTAHYNHLVGHAYANGNWGTKTGGTTLVGELGREIVVDPGSGTWHTVGDNGAEFVNIPAGSIVFNHLQSEALLERGFVNGRGTARANGTAMVRGGISVNQANIASGHTTYKGSSSSGSSNNSKSTSNNTKATNENTSATKSNTKSTKDSTETFDWVKVHLEKFSEAVERISNQITDYISSALKISLLKKQMKAIDKQIVAEQQGYDAYMNKANSIGISDDYKNKVINGTLSIEDIDTSTDAGKKLAKDVKNFQTYYNSAIDCKDSVQELNNKLLELYETLANMPTEKAEKAIDKLKSKYESFSNIGDAISGSGSAISILTKTIKTDNPKLATALTNQRKAQSERNKTKKIRSDASKNLKAEKNDINKSGSKLVQASAKNVATSGKALKKVTKGNTDSATYNAIAQAVRNGTAVSLKGLKGNVLKEAKAYNKSLNIDKKVNTAVKSNKKVSTSGMSKSLKNVANPYNKDAKNLDAASKAYDTARKNDDKALQNLNKATDVKEAEYRKTSKAQQIIALNKDRNSYVIQNKLLDYQADNLKQQMEQRQKATNEASRNYEKDRKKVDAAKKKQDSLQKSLLKDKSFTSSLSKDQLSKLKSGKSFSLNGLTGDNLKKGQQWLNQLKQSSTLTTKAKITQDALTKAVEESTASEAEYAKTLAENAQKKLDNISDYYDSKMALTENKNSLLNNYMDRMQTRGYDLSSTFYTAQIANYKKIANDQKAQLAAMKEAFQDALDNGSIVEGTQDFWDMQNAIDQVTISITETTNSIVDLQAKMRDLEWEQFDKGQEAVGRIASESDFLIKLLSHKDLYQKDTGKLTDEGLATMGLHGVNYNTYMAQADKYKEEMLKISKELANDPYNQKLIDRKNELVDAQQDAILSAEDEKDAMKDLVKDGIDKELDALKDLIDKYEDKLQAEKDLYDYEKKIRDKSEKVASLQKQLVALQGDNSEENKAKLQELRKNLKDAQEDLEDTQYDKYISDQKDLLDDFYDKYEEILNQRLDNIDTLIQDCINQVNSGSGKISDTINSASQNVNYNLSADMKQIWTSTDNVSSVISAYEKGTFTTQTTAVKTAVDNVWNRQKDMIDAINEMAEKYVQKSENDTQQQTPTKAEIGKVEEKAPKPETPKDKNNAVGTVGHETLSKKDDKGKTEGTLSDDDSPSSSNKTGTGNGKAEVGDKVTFASGVYHGSSDGSGRTGNYYLGKQVKIAHINKGAPYPYSIVSADGKTQLGWVKLNQLKGYASGIMKVPNDQLAWTQEQGEEAIVRNDGSILTPLSRDMSVLNADMTKNLWNFMGNPSGFLNDYSNGEKFGVKNEDYSSSVEIGDITIQCNMPNVQNSKDFLRELTTNKDVEKAIRAMTVDRLNGGSSLKKYKYRS